MMELTIKGEVYQFKFGIGFLKLINKEARIDLDMSGNKKNVGFMYCVSYLIDRDVETLVKVLDIANKGQTPRLAVKTIEDYIDEECEDIEALFDMVLDFLEQSNACKLAAKPIREEAKKQAQEMKK